MFTVVKQFPGRSRKSDPHFRIRCEFITQSRQTHTRQQRVTRLSSRLDRTPRIAVRINPDFIVKQSGMVMGGGSQPFGIDLDQVDAALEILKKKGLACAGLHCYAGSLTMMLNLVRQHELMNISLNLGGGFGIPYFSHEKPLDIHTVGIHLGEILDRNPLKHCIDAVIIELGRYLVAESGVYVVRVIDKKISRGKKYLIVEGGMNHHLAATGNLGQAVRRNFPMSANPSQGLTTENADMEMVSVVGPLCTPLDILASDVLLPTLLPGDHIAVLNSGAYGCSASPHGFLSHPPPVEILL